MVNVIQHFLSLTQSKGLKNNKSYDTLVKHHIDSLMLMEIQFFEDVAYVFHTYVTQYQGDALLVPFIYNEMVLLFTKTMQFCIKRE